MDSMILGVDYLIAPKKNLLLSPVDGGWLLLTLGFMSGGRYGGFVSWPGDR